MKKTSSLKKISLFLVLLLFYTSIPFGSFAENDTVESFLKMKNLPTHKIFKIQFNDSIDTESIRKHDNICVVDSKKNLQEISLRIDPSNDHVLLIDPPKIGYTLGGEYTLYIYNNWTSKSNKKMKQGIHMHFNIAATSNPQSPDSESNFVFDKTSGTITSYAGNATDLIIPDQIDGIAVRYIGREAFKRNLFITAVTIPDSVIAINYGAFYECKNLRSLTLGKQLDSIGTQAFEGCQITTLTLPPSLHTVNDLAFFDNQIRTLNFSKRSELETIGKSSFSSNKISSLAIPNSVRSIEEYAFSNNNISTLTFEDGTKSIALAAFSDNQITSLVIPNSVKSIAVAAFTSNPLETVELAEHTVIHNADIDTTFPTNTKIIRRP